MISIGSVVKQYLPSIRINEVFLDIPADDVTMLMDPSSAGRSTILTMIGRPLGIDEDIVEVDGLNVIAAKSSELTRTLSILRQENHFISCPTVRQPVGLGHFPCPKGRLSAEDEAIIDRYVGFLNLEGLEGHYLNQLSGGQRQHAYITMVLAQGTEYVLSDRPFNNLDITRSVEMIRMLERTAHGLSCTIVIVLHDIDPTACYASQVCALREKTVAFMGAPEEVMRDEALTNTFNTPVTVMPDLNDPTAYYF